MSLFYEKGVYLNLSPFLEILNLENYDNPIKKVGNEFNSLFAEKGWIATDDTPVPLIKKSLDIVKNKGIEDAENYICNNLPQNFFENALHRMSAIWVYQDRKHLIELAYEDHKSKRYHSSVPVILSQIDGILYDIASNSFFEKKPRYSTSLKSIVQ